jgi:TatD DNase family protein
LTTILKFFRTRTFSNARRVREAALAVPRDRVLVETDAPYLAPHPLRGQLNHSGLLTYTLDSLASLWGISPEDAAHITSQNAQNLFFSERNCAN